VSPCKTYIDQFGCEGATYDDVCRTIKYKLSMSLHDDAPHATKFALLLEVRWFHKPLRKYYVNQSRAG
jgi:hypothetical protein